LATTPGTFGKRLPLDLTDEAGKEAVGVGGPVHVALHAGQGISGVDAIHHAEFVAQFPHAVGERFEQRRAFRDRRLAPACEGFLGGGDGAIDIGLAGQGHLAQICAVGWINRSE
jgi:hypothetical protein